MSDHALELQLDLMLDELCIGNRGPRALEGIALAPAESQELAMLTSFTRTHLAAVATEADGAAQLAARARARVLTRIANGDAPHRSLRTRWSQRRLRAVALALLLASFSTVALAETNTPVGRALRQVGHRIVGSSHRPSTHKPHSAAPTTPTVDSPAPAATDENTATARPHRRRTTPHHRRRTTASIDTSTDSSGDSGTTGDSGSSGSGTGDAGDSSTSGSDSSSSSSTSDGSGGDSTPEPPDSKSPDGSGSD